MGLATLCGLFVEREAGASLAVLAGNCLVAHFAVAGHLFAPGLV